MRWIIFILCIAVALSSQVLLADQESESLAKELSNIDPSTKDESVESTDDPRLPPTIPGETVIVGDKKMKVTTTVGSVPVSPVPEPWKDQHSDTVDKILKDGGLIIDRREGSLGGSSN